MTNRQHFHASFYCPSNAEMPKLECSLQTRNIHHYPDYEEEVDPLVGTHFGILCCIKALAWLLIASSHCVAIPHPFVEQF